MQNTILIILIVWVYFRYFGPLLITFKKTNLLSKIPTKSYGKAACWDVYSTEKAVIPVGQWREIPIGIAFAPWPHIYIPFLKLTFK